MSSSWFSKVYILHNEIYKNDPYAQEPFIYLMSRSTASDKLDNVYTCTYHRTISCPIYLLLHLEKFQDDGLFITSLAYDCRRAML